MQGEFSVLMSLYIKEKSEYFDECMKSILANTVLPNEIVVVLDGPISDELKSTLDRYVDSNPDLYKIVPLEMNRGLGLALREGIQHCSNELIARMDTDDICRRDRFETQLEVFKEHPEIDICGSHILEFDKTTDIIIAKRKVPITDREIKKYQRKRCSFNHMSVMYKKSSVIKAGNYVDCPLMEDDMLWVSMFNSGATACNVDDYLVYARIGKDMYERRGGFSYYKKYKKARKQIYSTGFISWFDYKYTLLIQFIVAMMPNKLRGFLFRKVLHK